MRTVTKRLRQSIGGGVLIALALCCLAGAAAPAEGAEGAEGAKGAQDANPAAQPTVREELDELRKKVEELEAQQQESDDEVREVLLEGKGWSAALPELTIGGFANVDYQYTNEHGRGSGGSDNHFALGDLDLFLVSQLSDRISFLSEILFEFDSDGGTDVDAERLLLRYEHADWLKIAAGRGHTPIGYWNTAFHHGTWLWTTMRRPLIFEFEDEGGIMPLHFIGLEAHGYIETSTGLFSYHSVTGNGRGKKVEDVQVTDDVNDSKMVATQLSFQLNSMPELKFGVNALWDEIPRDRPARERTMDEVIVGAHVIHSGDPLELYVEGQWIRHEGGGSFDSYGGYAQVAYRIGKFKPYYRFDLLEIDGDDPYFAQGDGFDDLLQHTVGLRFDWASFAALKFEYRRLNDDGGPETDTFAAQFSVAF
jgi:hypothetical protein